MILVRAYEDRDREAVIETIRTVYAEYGFGWDPEGYHADVHDVPTHYPAGFWVGEAGGETLGCVGLLVFPPVPGEAGTVVQHEGDLRIAGCDCEVMRLYVHPRGRRRGLGSALMEAVLVEARSAGCSRMEVWSDKLLVDAHRLYARLGAVTVGERLCPPPDETPEWGMWLGL